MQRGAHVEDFNSERDTGWIFLQPLAGHYAGLT